MTVYLTLSKVTVKVLVKDIIWHAMKVQRGGGGIALSILCHGIFL